MADSTAGSVPDHDHSGDVTDQHHGGKARVLELHGGEPHRFSRRIVTFARPTAEKAELFHSGWHARPNDHGGTIKIEESTAGTSRWMASHGGKGVAVLTADPMTHPSRREQPSPFHYGNTGPTFHGGSIVMAHPRRNGEVEVSHGGIQYLGQIHYGTTFLHAHGGGHSSPIPTAGLGTRSAFAHCGGEPETMTTPRRRRTTDYLLRRAPLRELRAQTSFTAEASPKP